MNVVLGSRASTLSSAVSSLANTGISFTKVDEREKQVALEEEQARLKALKVNIRLLSHIFRAQVSPVLLADLRWELCTLQSHFCHPIIQCSYVHNKWVLLRVWVHIVVDVSFCSANASLQMITGSASERAPEESSHSHHRFVPRVHGGRNHQLGPGHWPLLDPQLHQQVRSQACTLSLRKLLWLFVTYCARRNR